MTMRHLFNKQTQSIKKTQIQEKTKILTILKDNWYYIIIVLLINGLYFSSDFLPTRTSEFIDAKKVYSASIVKVTDALNVVKKEAEGTLAMKNYENAKKLKNIEKTKYYNYKDSIKFLSFNDFWQFLYEFGKSFPYLLLLIFLQFWFLTRRKINIGMMFLISSFLCLSIFKMFWIFHPFQDLSKPSYYIISIVTTFLLFAALYTINQYKKTTVQRLHLKTKKLQEQKEKLLIHTILNSKDEAKKKEILEYLENNMA